MDVTNEGMEIMARHGDAVAVVKVTTSKAAAMGGCR